MYETVIPKLSSVCVQSYWAELEKISALSKGQKTYRRRSKDYFGGAKKLTITAAEQAAYNKRAKAAGTTNSGATLKKTVKGFAAHTHRARTNFYPTPEAIPLKKIRFIASTG